MKNLYLTFCLMPLLLLQSCIYYNSPEPNPHTAVIMQRAEFEAAVQAMPQQEMFKSGKIYIKDNFMFINDVNKGFHVFDYSNAENPIKLGFINIPGATDLAVRNNVIYINQATDLVSISYNPIANTLSVLHRNESVFPQKLSPYGFQADTDADEIVIDWTEN